VGSNPIIHPNGYKSLIFKSIEKSSSFCAKLAPNSTDNYGLVNNPENKNTYPFKEAKLNTRNNDLSKRWYVEFSAWCVLAGNLRRKRIYQVNNKKTLGSVHLTVFRIHYKLHHLLFIQEIIIRIHIDYFI
jgi:hypothetical protein